ncbi:hypothetical protein [Natronosalvus rutilus]|uniref:Uncharacterized protein n=1 Tax=Natronosalvus rutilus TaxID=2953753 RepID=A0A9E7N928_9EURY|nr:hypothetical protein [Natronosalvus rutilus]UTF52744.1 hypothetical protein NGM29_13255 [Natronosalvus rutilus]
MTTKDSKATHKRWLPSRHQFQAIVFSVLLILSLPAMAGAGVMAAETDDGSTGSGDGSTENTTVRHYDDFEDGDYEGWTPVRNPDAVSVVDEGFYGGKSLRLDDSGGSGEQGDILFDSGPLLKLSDDFEIQGTSRFEDNSTQRSRIGVRTEDLEDRLLLTFSKQYDSVSLTTDWGENPEDHGEYIEGAHHDMWVDWRIQVDSGTARAKVWESGTKEPEKWQMVRDFNNFEGYFYANAGNGDYGREVLIDHVDLGGHTISGQVLNRHGDPVSNATVEAYGVNFDGLENQADDLEAEADRLLDEAENMVPNDWDSDLQMLGSGGLVDEAQASEWNYIAVHEREDWDLNAEHNWKTKLAWGDGAEIDPDLGAPSVQTNERNLVLSIWDPTDVGGTVTDREDAIDRELPGRTTSGTVVIEQISPSGEAVDKTKRETEVIAEDVNPTYSLAKKDHEAVRVSLPRNHFYRVYPEGQPESSYVFAIGDPDDFVSAIQSDLRDEANRLTDWSEEIQSTIESGSLTRTTTTTDENGYYELNVQRPVQKAAVQAYKGDPELLQGELGASVSQLRGLRDMGYNGSIGMTLAPTRTDVPANNVTLEMHELDTMPFDGIDDFEELMNQLTEEFLNSSVYQDRWDEIIEEIEGERLSELYENYYNLVDGNEELRDRVEELLGRELHDPDDDPSVAEMQAELEAIRQALAEQATGDIGIGDGDYEFGDDGLTATWQVPSWVGEDDVAVNLLTNGTTEPIPDEYISVEPTGGFAGTNTVTVSNYPIDDGVTLADLELVIAGEHGVGDGIISIANPEWDGTAPKIDAVDFTDLSPGPDETVGVSLDATENYDSLVDATVFGPDGNELESSLSTSGEDRLTFKTSGAGDYHVRLYIESTSGDIFQITERVRAGEQSRSDRATVRIGQSRLGYHATIGDHLESARVDVDGSKIGIDVIAPSDEIPGEIHLMPDAGVTTNDVTFDVSVLEGASESRINGNVAVLMHFESGYDDDTLAWRNGRALPADGNTFGEVLVREEKHILVSYTASNGEVYLRTDMDPGWGDRAWHKADQYIPRPSLPFFSTILVIFESFEADVERLGTVTTTTVPATG